MGLKREASARVPGASGGFQPPPADKSVLGDCPLLCGFLSDPEWEDGEARRTGTLLLFSEEGRWKGMLNDRDAGAVAFVSGMSVQGVLDALEEGLSDCDLDWRLSRATRGRKGS